MQSNNPKCQDLTVHYNCPQNLSNYVGKGIISDKARWVLGALLEKMINGAHNSGPEKGKAGKKEKDKKKERKNNAKQFSPRKAERKKVISINPGERTLKVVSLNPDSMNRECIDNIIRKMKKQKIHIACVQETKCTRNLSYKVEGFKILSTAAITGKNGSPDGGAAIIVNDTLAPMIRKVVRYNERVIQVTLQNAAHDIPVNIISIYAPHNGHAIEKRKLFWKEVNKNLMNVHKKGIVICGIDANGQLGAGNNGTKHERTIGMWTNAKATEKGNGTSLRNLCTKSGMVPMNTWKQQAQTKNNDEYVTWPHPNGNTKRQIDYILVNQRY